jgi:hypothetical protein
MFRLMSFQNLLAQKYARTGVNHDECARECQLKQVYANCAEELAKVVLCRS